MNDRQPTILIIGYGNDLRSDDAVGKIASQTISSWQLPNVDTLTLHQLTPELAENIAKVDRVIFIDAYPASENCPVRVEPLEMAATKTSIDHASNPRSLLALVQTLYKRAPQAWLVTIPAVNFELGEEISLVARQGIKLAIAEIERLIKTISVERFLL